MPFYTDQMNRVVDIPDSPQRIISTVPSQTELLYSLGLEKEVCGITSYCVHPANWLKEKTVIGGTKNLQIKNIRELKPDLIICNKEENIREQVMDLAEEFPVWVSDVNSLDDALEMISGVGEITDRQKQATDLRQNIETARGRLQEFPPIRFFYFIWDNPLMLAGRNTFISKVLEEFGMVNAAPDHEQRYPEIEFSDIERCDPQLLILSSEPYPFTSQKAHELACHFPKTLVKIMDGQLFSWYGSRIVLTFKHLPVILADSELVFLKN